LLITSIFHPISKNEHKIYKNNWREQ